MLDNRFNNIVICVLTIFVLVSCSTKKDKFLNRNFHAMGSYYNILYNGNLALSNGQEQLAQTYQENYWDILPVERLEITLKQGVKSETTNQDFKRAEEKATKAIQKHSMYMGGKEYNPQMDEAFLLLGKSRYFDQRFIPAKDALGFILTHYPKSSTINEVKVWVEKTNLRLGYFNQAIDELSNLLQTQNLETEVSVLANSTLAEAYVLTNSTASAVPYLSTAIQLTKDNQLKGRLLYIKSQLFQQLGQLDSADVALEQIISLNRKTPRNYRIHAFLEQKKLRDYSKVSYDSTLLFFQELIEDRENRPFLDYVFYEKAQFFRAKDSIQSSILAYNKSLREQSADRYLSAQNYKQLGDIYFNRAAYVTSGKYYDSTLTNLVERTREKLRIQKKRDNLDDVIKFEGIAKTNDSILWLVNASPKARLDYFTKYTDSLKTEAKSVFASDNAIKLGSDFKRRSPSKVTSVGTSGSSFYNTAAKDAAYKKFTKTWGDIQLADNWRTNAKDKDFESSEDKNEKGDQAEDQFTEPKFQPETYITQIPTQTSIIDSINDERNFAYYQLGIIYKENFRRYDLATEKLEAVLKQNPEERLILPSKYYLYKIYQITGNTALASKWKSDILNQHPNSNYAKIIRNPEALLNDKNSPQQLYYKTYKQFETGNFETALNNCINYSAQFTGMAIAPKFELLKAKAIGRIEGLEAYKKSLNYVALTFPQSDEGKYAQELYNTVDQNFISNKFQEPSENESFKLLFEIGVKQDNIEQLKTEIENYLSKEGFNFKVTLEFYNKKTSFISIHGLSSKLGAEGLANKLKLIEGLNELAYFTASAKNYEVIQIYKNKEKFKAKQS